MATIVRGRDVDVWVERPRGSGLYVPYACATSCSMEETAEEILITTVDSGREDEYETGATNCIINLEGVVTLDELPKYQMEDFQVTDKEKIRLDLTNSFGDRLRYEMNVIIPSKSFTGDVNDFSTYSVSMKRSGAYVKTKIYDNILVDGSGNPILDGGGNLIRVT